MQDTGRIRGTISQTAQRVLFDRRDCEGWDEVVRLLDISSNIDLAHVVMLTEQGILSRERARPLASAIVDLKRRKFEPIKAGLPTRGMYLLYEDYLIEQLGSDIAGRLHTGRSRNDLNATVLRVQVRTPYSELMRELLRLIAAMLVQARRHVHTVMPMYTHGQPAMPSTYAHYLSGLATALIRDLEAIKASGEELSECPLGAAAGAGTSWPLNTPRTACLLGFTKVTSHSLEAVASRSFVLRQIAAAAIAATTLSRLAADFRQWTTSEFGFFDLPDSVVGSSSAMPQKRNPYFLEHVHGKAGLVTAAFQAAATAMCGTPFANCIAVGTEAVRSLWIALDELRRAVVLLRLVIASARPRADRMLHSAVVGYTTAIMLADSLVKDGGIDFRSAHAMVGRIVSEAETNLGRSFSEIALRHLGPLGIPRHRIQTDPGEAIDELRYGNGPAPECVQKTIYGLRQRWTVLYRCRQVQRQHWKMAQHRLEECVSAIIV